MASTEFNTPEFLKNYTTDDVYEKMRDILPEDIDSSEGSHTWNLLRPTALVASELAEFVLPQVVQLIFPEWSYGEFLDAHAKTRGMTRKAAIAAAGEITVTGEAGTVIPEGSVFSTASLNNEDSSVSYETTEEATIADLIYIDLGPMPIRRQLIIKYDGTIVARIEWGAGKVRVRADGIWQNEECKLYGTYGSEPPIEITRDAVLTALPGASSSTYYIAAYTTSDTNTPSYTAITEDVTIPAGETIKNVSLVLKPGTYSSPDSIPYSLSAVTPIPIQCTQAGSIGNTGPGTIILTASTLQGITGVTNPEATTGGVDEETDEELIERIDEYDQNQGDSFVGSIADYKRWAMSISGVGNALVVPADDSTGLVTIVVTDQNGEPASEEICTAVYNYIMSPDAPIDRLAPINANLSVVAPTTVAIGVTATVELVEEDTLDAVQAAFVASLTEYMDEAQDDGEVKTTRVSAILSATAGVNDFEGLEIGIVGSSYSAANITLTQTQLPTINSGNIVLTEGTVS